jgi:hypothetical protein
MFSAFRLYFLRGIFPFSVRSFVSSVPVPVFILLVFVVCGVTLGVICFVLFVLFFDLLFVW